MYLLSALLSQSQFESFVFDLAVGVFALTIVAPLIFIWLIVAGAKLGKAVSEYLAVRDYEFDSRKFRLAEGRPLGIIDGTFGALEYRVGFRTYIVKAEGLIDTPAYVLYKIRRPSYGIFYNREYQRDNVREKILGIVMSLVFIVILLLFMFG